VINLKGNNRNSAYFLLEREKCRKLGVTMVNHTIFSRQMPNLNVLLDARKMLENAEYPALIHCKAGCDRAGIISTLYQYFVEKQPMEISIKELDFWRYGHFRYAKTGKMDFFFNEFIKYNKENPERKKDLISWCKTVMDREDLESRFVKRPWADFLTDYILRRQ
jgi:protein tyrosine/serine phosphatase